MSTLHIWPRLADILMPCSRSWQPYMYSLCYQTLLVQPLESLFRSSHCTLQWVQHTGRTLKGEIRGVPRISIITSNGDDPDPENKCSKDVDDRPRRNHEWRSDIRYLTPYIIVSSYHTNSELAHVQSNVSGKRPMPLFIPNN